MARYVPSVELVERIVAGETAAIARLISRAEAGIPEARPALAQIYSRSGAAHVIGITGVPGSGKSTLVAHLAHLLRSQGKKVGIVAVDPSSPYSGGAILGDRIRMTELAMDPGIFIRSMATRGAMGGMARAALDAVDVLDVGGFETIIIETVGVGQDEVEIARASHTTVVVSAPGLGDEIQAIKAGILEIADIHVVSKCDRSDANRTLTDLKSMLTLGLSGGVQQAWRPQIVGVSSVNGQGFDELVGALDKHREFAFGTEFGRERQLKIADFRLKKTAENLLMERFTEASTALSRPFAERLRDREADPYSLASDLVASAMKKEHIDEPV